MNLNNLIKPYNRTTISQLHHFRFPHNYKNTILHCKIDLKLYKNEFIVMPVGFAVKRIVDEFAQVDNAVI